MTELELGSLAFKFKLPVAPGRLGARRRPEPPRPRPEPGLTGSGGPGPGPGSVPVQGKVQRFP